MQNLDSPALEQNPRILLFFAVALVFGRRSKKHTEPPYLKQMRSMLTALEKGKPIAAPPAETRQEIITDLFESKMRFIGLEPSMDSGHVPVGFTPFAVFLHDLGVSEDIAGAMVSGLEEAETETEVLEMVDAAAESTEIDLHGSNLAKARELAVEEWKRLRSTR